MKLTDAELVQVITQRWRKCLETNGLYWRALKPLEALRTECDEAIAAYKEVQAEFTRRTRGRI